MGAGTRCALDTTSVDHHAAFACTATEVAWSSLSIDRVVNRSIHADLTTFASCAAGHELLDRADRPTAIFAANDNLAVGVLSAARALGLEPGQDFSIVGYNDIPLASRLPVPLTSVHTPFDQIATTAFELLLSDSSPGTPLRRALPTLIPRASTARA
ncbi:substrate-binding domain-containing protein [Promicromonospora soli]